MMNTLAAWVLTALLQDAQEVLAKYEKLRPTERDLGMYRLDWAKSLEEAKIRAAKEDRPIFLVSVYAHYGEIFTGHC